MRAKATFAQPVSRWEIEVERTALAAFHRSEAARLAPYWRRVERSLFMGGTGLLVLALWLLVFWLESR